MLTSDVRPSLAASDVVVDFSRATATLDLLAACREARKPLLIGTTGLPVEFEREFEAVSRDVPLLVTANVRFGVAVLLDLVSCGARILSRDVDIEVMETHERLMEIAPSDTALALGRPVMGSDQAVQRRVGDIGFAVVRGSNLPDEHTITFTGPDEQIVLTRRTISEEAYFHGAVRAALWLARQPPGRYRMQEVSGYRIPGS